MACLDIADARLQSLCCCSMLACLSKADVLARIRRSTPRLSARQILLQPALHTAFLERAADFSLRMLVPCGQIRTLLLQRDLLSSAETTLDFLLRLALTRLVASMSRSVVLSLAA
jgi:hypothetical protein